MGAKSRTKPSAVAGMLIVAVGLVLAVIAGGRLLTRMTGTDRRVAFTVYGNPEKFNGREGLLRCHVAGDRRTRTWVLVYEKISHIDPVLRGTWSSAQGYPEERKFKNFVNVVVKWPPDPVGSGVWVDGRKLRVPKGISVYFVSDTTGFSRIDISPEEAAALRPLAEDCSVDVLQFLETTLTSRIEAEEVSVADALEWEPAPVELHSHPYSRVIKEFEATWVVPEKHEIRRDVRWGFNPKALAGWCRIDGELRSTEGPLPVAELLANIDRLADSKVPSLGVKDVERGDTRREPAGYLRTIRYGYRHIAGEITVALSVNDDNTSGRYDILVRERPAAPESTDNP